MRLRIALATLALATPAIPAAAQTQAGATRDAYVRKLDSIASAPVLDGRAAGLAIAVVKGNDTLLLKGYGKADVEWNVPTPADAVFEIGSITKQFTAAAILQLRDEGKLSLDDDVTKFLPTFDTKGHKVPLRRLLDHTSGIKGITEIREFGELATRNWHKDSALALMARHPFDFAPGEAMIYNNSAFILLGHVIEKASGMSYEDYVEQKIFAPLGMTRSMYCNSNEVVERRAHGYQFAPPTQPERAANPQARPRIRRASTNVHIWPYSAGSLCSTAGDMVTWLRALHGGKVLSAKSYAEMTTPSKLADGTPLRYGMGIAVSTDWEGRRVIEHGGAITGYTAQASWYPDSQLAVVVLTNANGPANPDALSQQLAAAVIPGKPFVAKNFSGDASSFVGTYSGPSRGRTMTVVITQVPEGIAVSPNGAPARPAQWLDGWSFRSVNNILTFKRAGNSGPATELRVDAGGGLYVLKRQP